MNDTNTTKTNDRIPMEIVDGSDITEMMNEELHDSLTADLISSLANRVTLCAGRHQHPDLPENYIFEEMEGGPEESLEPLIEQLFAWLARPAHKGWPMLTNKVFITEDYHYGRLELGDEFHEEHGEATLYVYMTGAQLPAQILQNYLSDAERMGWVCNVVFMHYDRDTDSYYETPREIPWGFSMDTLTPLPPSVPLFKVDGSLNPESPRWNSEITTALETLDPFKRGDE
tara:strand:+ start:371 stop:1057 length:687 start_codon:yes stop_codon:yes gene_type:complete